MIQFDNLSYTVGSEPGKGISTNMYMILLSYSPARVLTPVSYQLAMLTCIAIEASPNQSCLTRIYFLFRPKPIWTSWPKHYYAGLEDVRHQTFKSNGNENKYEG